jgi:protein required for attachment to host cells
VRTASACAVWVFINANERALRTLCEAPAGKRPPESSEQANDEATFAKQLAQRLNDAALKQELSRLVQMADPQTLGQLRPLLHLDTRQSIVTEIAKTFTNAPLEDIEAALG